MDYTREVGDIALRFRSEFVENVRHELLPCLLQIANVEFTLTLSYDVNQ